MKDFFGIRSTRQLIRSTWEELDLRIRFEDIVDDCTTSSDKLPLSARQGKSLRDLIKRIDSDDDGTVDNSKLLEGHPASYFARAEAADILVNSLMGTPNGLCPLDESGFVPANHLPSFVDVVLEVYCDTENNKIYEDEAHRKQIVPEKGKIYINLHEKGMSYRWGGSQLQDISSPDMVEMDEEATLALWNQVANGVHNTITRFIFNAVRDNSTSRIDCYVSSDKPNSVLVVNFLNSAGGVLGTKIVEIGEKRNFHVDASADIAASVASNVVKVDGIIMDSVKNTALSESVSAIIVG